MGTDQLVQCFRIPLPGKLIPLNVKLSFYIGAAVFLLAVLWTVLRTKEYSPEELKEFDESEKLPGEKILRKKVQAIKIRQLGKPLIIIFPELSGWQPA